MASDERRPPSAVPLPRHIAIVMDGNGRWAKKRFLPRTAGHREGARAVRRIVRACLEREIPVLTLFAFSSENWRRPLGEVRLLMDLFVETLRTEIDNLCSNDVRIRFIGDRSAFARPLQELMHEAEQRTLANDALTLVIAANYGGRWDMVQATRQLAREVLEGRLDIAAIDSRRIGESICLHDLPEPDLFIRTGGEQRISNFLLWQLAYTELYFTDRLWPDFNADDLDKACASYTRRQRRFGQTGEQVEQGGGA